MKRQNFTILFILLLVCQMVLYSYFQFTPLVTVSVLAAMILCVPLTVGTPLCMLIAMVSGLTVDFISEGFIGLNAASLIPVAFARKGIISIFLGKDLIVRKDAFTYKKEGALKISGSVLTAQAIFFLFYITLDGVNARGLAFNMVHFFASLLVSAILSLLVVKILTPDEKR